MDGTKVWELTSQSSILYTIPYARTGKVQDTWTEVMGLLPVITDLVWNKESLHNIYQLMEKKTWKGMRTRYDYLKNVMYMPNPEILYVWILPNPGIPNVWILPWMTENLVVTWKLPYWKHLSIYLSIYLPIHLSQNAKTICLSR